MLEEVLGKGYFPKELPPCFTTEALGTALSDPGIEVPSRERTEPTTFNLARPGALRRQLSIPNPSSQYALASLCAQHWDDLDEHMKRSHFSTTRPKKNTAPGGRWLGFVLDPGKKAEQRVMRTLGGRFTLFADIADYYRSVYSHSIEWALIGKKEAKQKAGSSTGLGADLDKAVRHGQQGQSVGLPVGPDTSLLLSELVMCTLDAELERAEPRVADKAIRFMDDFEFKASSVSEAERVHLAWESLLSAYGFALNGAKTTIVEGPVPPARSWAITLSQMRLRQETERKLTFDLTQYFSTAIDLSLQHPRDRVLAYALGRLQNMDLGDGSWPLLERILLTACESEPSVLERASRFFRRAVEHGIAVDRDSIAQCLHDIITRNAPLAHGSEVVWCLYTLAGLGIDVSRESSQAVVEMDDNTCALLLYKLAQEGRVEAAPDMTPLFEKAEAPGAWSCSDWLLTYEMIRSKEVCAAVDQPVWRRLLEADVALLNSVPTWGKGADNRHPARAGSGRRGKDNQETSDTTTAKGDQSAGYEAPANESEDDEVTEVHDADVDPWDSSEFLEQY